MCLIVLKPKGANNSFTKEKFDNALIANPHGIGIAYSEGGKLIIEKFAQPQDIADKIYEKIANKDAFLIHFRYATHGVKDEVNVHPFIITDNLCVAHNGVIRNYKEINKDWSDTKNYVEGVLKPYIQEHGQETFKSPEFIKMVEEQIGYGSKMVFVDNNMNYSIANEKAGSWIDGCWYSNTYSIEDYTKKRQAAADKKAWASSYNDKKYDNLDDYDFDYDYGNYYGNYYDNYRYRGYDEYLKGTMTMDEINEYIAKEVADGYTDGDEIPYALDVDWDNFDIKDEDDQYKILYDISKQIEKGIYKGTVPCVWELSVDKEDLEYFLKKDNNK